MSRSDRLTPFSYVILVLVGRGGAGAHDLRRMSTQGRVYWDAAPSQWYAEPKRLAALGYLAARREPGRTGERTHYVLTAKAREALEGWVRTPAPLPRIQNEPVVRLLAADLVDPAAVTEGLAALRDQVDEAEADLAASRRSWASLPHRAPLLEVNDRFARRMVALQRQWLEEAERLLQDRDAAADPDRQ